MNTAIKGEFSAPETNQSAQAETNLIQINASPEEVDGWIESFIRERRKQIDKQNIKDFTVPPETRQNCARVDALLVKRRNLKSHVGVENVSNFWGPQNFMSEGRNMPPVPEPCQLPSSFKDNFSKQNDIGQSSKEISPKKKFSVAEINEKLSSLQKRTKWASDSDSS